jgi:23S rRNA (cytidine1920-2'-O)/16S rRNA (cytidine1409-2'-O)-methyltransferase
MGKVRVDILLVERGLVESRSLAQRMVMAGRVRADGQVVSKPSALVPQNTVLEVDSGSKYVSRGGDKLEAVLRELDVEVKGQICADVGSSTGGFTDCLLQHGGECVYAIDVGKGILHWKLRQHPKVVVMEGTNARYLDHLPKEVNLVTVDASFISLKVLLPVIRGWFGPSGGHVIALIKPQFEAGRKEAARGKGVIRDPEVHRRVLHEVLVFAMEEDFGVRGLIRSPLLGPKGNVEFLTYLVYPGADSGDIESQINELLPRPNDSSTSGSTKS